MVLCTMKFSGKHVEIYLLSPVFPVRIVLFIKKSFSEGNSCKNAGSYSLNFSILLLSAFMYYCLESRVTDITSVFSVNRTIFTEKLELKYTS